MGGFFRNGNIFRDGFFHSWCCFSWFKGWHKTHHEFKAPVSLAAEYADWKEDIFVNMASTVVGIILCGCHPIELFFFVVFRIWETVDVHCGYALPFTPFR